MRNAENGGTMMVYIPNGWIKDRKNEDEIIDIPIAIITDLDIKDNSIF